MKPPRGSVVLGAWVVLVITAIGMGLYLIGPPADERARRIDRRRVAHLQAFAAATDLYWTRHNRLPASLDELVAEPGVSLITIDPESAEAYAYQSLDSTRYEVCASFDTQSRQTRPAPARNIWAHGSGQQCFAIEAKEVTRSPESRS